MKAPDSYDIKVQGSSPVGQVNITGGMRLVYSENRTVMHYQGNIQFGGRIASVGSRVMEMAVRSIMNQSFDMLHRYLAIKYKTAKRQGS